MAERVIVRLKPLAVGADDAGAALGVRKTKIYELVKEGRLTTIRVGSDQKILVASIERFVSEQLTAPVK